MVITSNAFIQLVPASNIQSISINQVIELFNHYRRVTHRTGKQLNWDYSSHAFPYTIQEITDEKCHLSSTQDRYNFILIAVNKETISLEDSVKIQPNIQISLTDTSTYGDKTKAIEFGKFLAKQLKGELHLFNKRVMYYYPRK